MPKDAVHQYGSVTIDEAKIARKAQNLTIAGTDTTSVTLPYLIWAVLRYPDTKEELLREIRDIVHGESFSAANVEELPYL